eukprot:562940-Amphidinium_carterae.1
MSTLSMSTHVRSPLHAHPGGRRVELDHSATRGGSDAPGSDASWAVINRKKRIRRLIASHGDQCQRILVDIGMPTAS